MLLIRDLVMAIISKFFNGPDMLCNIALFNQTYIDYLHYFVHLDSYIVEKLNLVKFRLSILLG